MEISNIVKNIDKKLSRKNKTIGITVSQSFETWITAQAQIHGVRVASLCREILYEVWRQETGTEAPKQETIDLPEPETGQSEDKPMVSPEKMERIKKFLPENQTPVRQLLNQMDNSTENALSDTQKAQEEVLGKPRSQSYIGEVRLPDDLKPSSDDIAANKARLSKTNLNHVSID